MDPQEEQRQIKLINEAVKLVEDLPVFLIEAGWWDLWQRHFVHPISPRPGRIDNSSLVDSEGDLKPGLEENKQYYYLPKESWDLLIQWFVILSVFYSPQP